MTSYNAEPHHTHHTTFDDSAICTLTGHGPTGLLYGYHDPNTFDGSGTDYDDPTYILAIEGLGNNDGPLSIYLDHERATELARTLLQFVKDTK